VRNPVTNAWLEVRTREATHIIDRMWERRGVIISELKKNGITIHAADVLAKVSDEYLSVDLLVEINKVYGLVELKWTRKISLTPALTSGAQKMPSLKKLGQGGQWVRRKHGSPQDAQWFGVLAVNPHAWELVLEQQKGKGEKQVRSSVLPTKRSSGWPKWRSGALPGSKKWPRGRPKHKRVYKSGAQKRKAGREAARRVH
jgi:hypothetical protein